VRAQLNSQSALRTSRRRSPAGSPCDQNARQSPESHDGSTQLPQSCSAGAACLSTAAATFSAWGAEAKPKPYAHALLVTDRGEPMRASELKAQTNYVFHYPFVATPVFLLDLAKPVAPHALSTPERTADRWPGGVGRNRRSSPSRRSARTSSSTRRRR